MLEAAVVEECDKFPVWIEIAHNVSLRETATGHGLAKGTQARIESGKALHVEWCVLYMANVDPSIEDEIALASSPVDEIQVEDVVNTDDQDEDDEEEDEEEEVAGEDTPKRKRGRQATKRGRGRPRGRGRGRITTTIAQENSPPAPEDSPLSPEEEEEEEDVEEEVVHRNADPGHRSQTKRHKRRQHAQSWKRVISPSSTNTVPWAQ
jgi:hypothetical protein